MAKASIVAAKQADALEEIAGQARTIETLAGKLVSIEAKLDMVMGKLGITEDAQDDSNRKRLAPDSATLKQGK